MLEMMANRYLLNGDEDKAIELYRQALLEKGENAKLRCRLIGALLRSGREDQARDELERMREGLGVARADRLLRECSEALGESRTDPALARGWERLLS